MLWVISQVIAGNDEIYITNTALLDRLAVVNRHMIVRNWIGSFGSLNLSKIWDCRSFSDLKPLPAAQFSHSEDFNCIL